MSGMKGMISRSNNSIYWDQKPTQRVFVDKKALLQRINENLSKSKDTSK